MEHIEPAQHEPGSLLVPMLIDPSDLRTLIGQRAERAYREEHDENID